MVSVYWLILLALLLLVEILTLGLTTIWFAGGALVAFIVSLFCDNIILEIILFITISLLLLFFTRPLILRYFNPRRVKTNYQSIIGKVGIVTKKIDNLNAEGQVNLEGQEWTARSVTGEVIEEGKKVVVKEILGVKLMVNIVKEEL